MGRRHPVTMQDVTQDTVYEANMSAATPDWCVVLDYLAPAFYPESTSCLSSVTRENSLLSIATK